jgi:hypothetical protein
METRQHAVLLSSHLLSLFLLLSEPVCISRTDGSWIGFGSNGNGQLGLGDIADVDDDQNPARAVGMADTTDRNDPTVLTALGTNDVESCALGSSHTICKK